jgi:hypothetical protein
VRVGALGVDEAGAAARQLRALCLRGLDHLGDDAGPPLSRLAQLAAKRGELKAPELVEHPELLLAPLWLAMMNNTVIHPEVPMNAGTLFRLQVTLLFKIP